MPGAGGPATRRNGAGRCSRRTLATVGHDHGVLHRVAELADVAGPRVGAERLEDVHAEARARQPQVLRDADGEELREQDDLGRTFAQRRDLERERTDAIIEVLTEAPRLDLAAQVAVRRADDAHVHGHLLRAADADDRAALEHAKKLGLHVRRHLADLVEEKSPAAGGLEVAGPLAIGAGERALLVTEQLTLDQRLGQRRAVQAQERPRPAGAEPVNALGDDFLSGPCFPGDEHGGLRHGDATSDREELDHRAIGEHEPVAVRLDVSLRRRSRQLLLAAARQRTVRARHDDLHRADRDDISAVQRLRRVTDDLAVDRRAVAARVVRDRQGALAEVDARVAPRHPSAGRHERRFGGAPDDDALARGEREHAGRPLVAADQEHVLRLRDVTTTFGLELRLLEVGGCRGLAVSSCR